MSCSWDVPATPSTVAVLQEKPVHVEKKIGLSPLRAAIAERDALLRAEQQQIIDEFQQERETSCQSNMYMRRSGAGGQILWHEDVVRVWAQSSATPYQRDRNDSKAQKSK